MSCLVSYIVNCIDTSFVRSGNISQSRMTFYFVGNMPSIFTEEKVFISVMLLIKVRVKNNLIFTLQSRESLFHNILIIKILELKLQPITAH